MYNVHISLIPKSESEEVNIFVRGGKVKIPNEACGRHKKGDKKAFLDIYQLYFSDSVVRISEGGRKGGGKWKCQLAIVRV